MGVKLSSRRSSSRRNSMMADINVTPMVDVMLVLLVIFMITAPLLTAGVSIDLPKAKARAVSQQDNAPLEIAIDGKGNLFMGEAKVTDAQLTAKLQAIAGETIAGTGAGNEKRVYLRADRRMDYGRVMQVMALISTAGFTKIALVTDPTMATQK